MSEVPLRYDPTPRTDLALPPRMPEAAQIAALRSALAASQAEVARLREALTGVIAACDQGRMMPAPGRASGGMTIEANICGSIYTGVPAWPIEAARAAMQGEGT